MDKANLTAVEVALKRTFGSRDPSLARLRVGGSVHIHGGQPLVDTLD